MIKIGVSGALGRMGKRIISLAKEDMTFDVVFGLEDSNCPDKTKDYKGVNIVYGALEIEKCQCLIEFSSPQATLEHLRCLVDLGKSVVIGTTGFTAKEVKRINEAAERTAIVFSPNMSVGVNLLFRLIKEAAGILKGYGIHVEEAHHIHKKDFPSGTAKKIARILKQEGFRIEIGDIVPIREGEIVGDHSVVFKSDLDEIELSHSAKSRDIFAKGALLAAAWVVDKKSGLYSMDDVLF